MRNYKMKKVLVISSLLLIGSVAAAQAYYYENSMPHNRTNAIDCVDCHGEPDWTGQTPQLPKLLKDCTSCHNNESGSGFTKTSAPHAQTHHGDCWDCHRNHDVRRWDPDPSVVTGSFGGTTYDPASNTTTFTGVSFTPLDALWTDPATWNAKTTADRGLNLWVSYPEGDDSFEVQNADATSITVKGDLTATTDGTFELHYGQMIPDALNGNPVIFTGPKTFADNDEQAGDWDGDGTLDDNTPDGVCQVCHTVTNHWRQDGSRATHFSDPDLTCTDCHVHSAGFLPAAGNYCQGCHGNPPVTTNMGGPDGLVNSPYPTGSTSPGAHARHSDQYGYTFACGICHTNGMPATPLAGNDQIQIGFQIWDFDGTGTRYDGRNNLASPFTYEATNGTQVTTGNTQTCSNIYCHSDGTSLATSYFTPNTYTGQNNTTPSWTSGGWGFDPDGTTCNNCHMYPPDYVNDDPKANSHFRHSQLFGVTCKTCHYQTTQDNVTIADSSKHHNGIYDVTPAPTFFANGQDKPLSFIYTYDAGGGTCSSNSCHNYWGTLDPYRWGKFKLYANANSSNGEICGEVNLNITVTGSFPSGSATPPYQCYYEWGDGAIQDWSTDCSGTHTYTDGNRKTITWSIRDAKRHTTNGTSFVGIETVNIFPSFSNCTDPGTIDTDGDGMTDVWETSHGLDPLNPVDAAFDLDGDGLINLYEFTRGTDPGLTDTDGDGVDDAHDGYPLDSQNSVCTNSILINGTSYFYNSIAELLNGGQLLENDTVMMSSSGLNENIVFNQPVTVNLSGGYDCDFTNNLVDTEITGSLTITEGTVIVDKITIK